MVVNLCHWISFLVLTSLPYPAVLEDVSKDVLLGIDFGSEWIKLVVVSQGSRVDTVLNENSKRKTLCAILFPEPGSRVPRIFGEGAISRPHKSISYFRELLGMSYSRKGVYGPHIFSHSIVANERRGTCEFSRDAALYSPEILNAMLMVYAKARAEEHTGKNVSKCVVTVPPYFNSLQRMALLSAARVAG
jgi:molecular chaperone DnaK (HSP70)